METYVFLSREALVEEVLEFALHPIRPRTRPKRPAARPVRAETKTAARQMKGECKCGTCRSCSENARWERIFSERFADPGYYERRQTLHSSSLNAWGS